VLLTTHYLEEAERHADRIAIMHRGVVEREGTLREIIGAEPSVITFTSEMAIDRVPFRVVRRRGPQVIIETRQLQQDLEELFRWAAEFDVHFSDLGTSSSSLDDVFRAVAHAS
jgi:ABC-2 type transport system ATP-binding protein